MTITARGFIKFDLVLLTVFSTLMAFLFYAGIDSLALTDNAINSLFGKPTPTQPADAQNDGGIEQRLQSPATLVINPQASSAVGAVTSPEQRILDLQNQVAQLNLQLQQIEPAAALEQPAKSCDCHCPEKSVQQPAEKKEHTATNITPKTAPQVSTKTATVTTTKESLPNKPIIKKVIAKTNNKILHGKTWLLSQKNSHYSMQILAVRSKQELHQEIKKSGLEIEQLAYYPTVRNGHVWYALLYGLFENRQQAQQALKKLPKHIRQNKPWLRSLRAIKKTIQLVPIEAK